MSCDSSKARNIEEIIFNCAVKTTPKLTDYVVITYFSPFFGYKQT